jgi:hypothetical protein
VRLEADQNLSTSNNQLILKSVAAILLRPPLVARCDKPSIHSHCCTSPQQGWEAACPTEPFHKALTMNEPTGIDSIPRTYSGDLRKRMIEAAAPGMPARSAQLVGIAVSTAAFKSDQAGCAQPMPFALPSALARDARGLPARKIAQCSQRYEGDATCPHTGSSANLALAVRASKLGDVEDR